MSKCFFLFFHFIILSTKPFFDYKLLISITISFLFPISLLAIPLGHLDDPKLFSYIRMELKTYKEVIPLHERFETIATHEQGRYQNVLVPKNLIEKWKIDGIPFEILKYPKRFVEIDPNYKNRIHHCIPSRDMLNGYKNNSINEFYLNCIAKEFPANVNRIKIGSSSRGKNIWAIRIRKNPSDTKERDGILIHCSIHGNEAISIEHCYDIMIQVLNYSNEYNHINSVDLWIVPILNPDGVDDFWFKSMSMGRKNGNGVDLNRNFPFMWNSGSKIASSNNPLAFNYRGLHPISEPETKAILHLVEKERFLFSLSYHCYANSILIPYSIENTINPNPNLVEKYGFKLIENITSFREDKPFLIKKNLYEVDGTDQDTFFHNFGTYAYLAESSHILENYMYIPMITEGLRPIWENLFNIYSDSWKVKIRTIDKNRNPLKAKIISDQFQYFENEIHESNSNNGNYNLIVPDKSFVKITVQKEGYKEKNVILSSSIKPERIDIILEKE
jgi:hypothetical protein